MNFSIISHLVRSDWQRLKRPLAVLWLLLFLAALPWLLHRPDDWQMPQWTSFGWNGRINPALVPRGGWLSPVIVFIEFAATVFALALAAMLGAQGAKHPVTPIRNRERLISLAASLLVFIVLPQWLLAAGNLLLHGFSPATAVQAAAATALTTWMLLGWFATLGAWLPSPWLLLAGCAALASSVGFISEFYRPLDSMMRGAPTLPMLPAGPKEWLFGVISITLLALLFPVFRHRLSGPWRVAVATLLVLLAGVTAILLPAPPVRVEPDPAIATSPIRPVLDRIQIQLEENSATSETTRLLVSGNMSAIGNPPGHGVRFEPTSGWISQNGKRVAAIRPQSDPYSSADIDAGYFTLNQFTLGADRAAQAALPGGGRHAMPGNRSGSGFVTFGQADLPTDAVISPDQDAELHMEFRGTVFRYEMVWNTALNKQTKEIRDGDVTWRVRRFDPASPEPQADVLCIHPALGISRNSDLVRWETRPLRYYRLFFSAPASGTHLEARNSLFDAAGPLYSAAGWERQVVTGENGNRMNLDLAGLRLIAMRPVAVAQFTATAVTRFRPWKTGDTADYDLTYRYSIGDSTYRRDFFPNRPDPQTCTREEFARWLRIAAHVFPGASGSEHDLAAFAPRFAGLMAKVAYHRSVGTALRLGVPEAMREEIIGPLDSGEWPDSLAEVALARGWLGEAKDSILARFKEGGMRRTDAVMALEDPSTYPKLIFHFLENPERETYEKLRLLPGIEPLLGDEIATAARETSIEFLKANLSSYQNSAPYGPFLYAAKRGDAVAFQAVLDLYRASGDKREYAPYRDLGYVLAAPKAMEPYDALTAWLRDKSAASFRFDPLLRLWKPLP